MRLPAAHLAVVDRARIRDSLLSPEHLVGRHKASFFHALVTLKESDVRAVRDEDLISVRSLAHDAA
jgi:hypothetical protein